MVRLDHSVPVLVSIVIKIHSGNTFLCPVLKFVGSLVSQLHGAICEENSVASKCKTKRRLKKQTMPEYNEELMLLDWIKCNCHSLSDIIGKLDKEEDSRQ